MDLLLGVGGTPEGIITACAMKAMDGVIQARLWPRDDAERRKALDAGHDLDRVLHTDDLVTGDNTFFVATGITDGELLRGVRYTPQRRADRVDRDALPQRHAPLGAQRPRPGQGRPTPDLGLSHVRRILPGHGLAGSGQSTTPICAERVNCHDTGNETLALRDQLATQSNDPDTRSLVGANPDQVPESWALRAIRSRSPPGRG